MKNSQRTLDLTFRYGWRVVLWGGVPITLLFSSYYLISPQAYSEFFGGRDPQGVRRLAALAHIVFAIGALVAGLVNLRRLTRKGPSRRHKMIGYLYACCVVTSATGALLIAPYTLGGKVNALGFALLAMSWAITTLIACFAAIRGQTSLHSRWIIYSFALTLAGVSLRIQMPLLIVALGLTFDQAYAIVPWSCWLPNLLLAHIWLRRRHQRQFVGENAANQTA